MDLDYETIGCAKIAGRIGKGIQLFDVLFTMLPNPHFIDRDEQAASDRIRARILPAFRVLAQNLRENHTQEDYFLLLDKGLILLRARRPWNNNPFQYWFESIGSFVNNPGNFFNLKDEITALELHYNSVVASNTAPVPDCFRIFVTTLKYIKDNLGSNSPQLLLSLSRARGEMGAFLERCKRDQNFVEPAYWFDMDAHLDKIRVIADEFKIYSGLIDAYNEVLADFSLVFTHKLTGDFTTGWDRASAQ
jgi:hypothetical protein